MIAPDMATMLGYVFTDAAVDAGVPAGAAVEGRRRQFTCITVDSDTSTSDTVLAFATGKASNPARRLGRSGRRCLRRRAA